jgi:hypothetical protein
MASRQSDRGPDRRNEAYRLLPLLWLLFFCWLGADARANGVGNFCPSGTCVIDNPVYVNVFWDASPAQWDADVGTSGMTQERINAVTMALIKSDYFSQLAQYKVYTPTMLPSITPPCQGPPNSMDAIEAVIKDVVSCVFGVNPALNNGNTIIVLFVPPQVAGGNYCAPGGRSAKHDKFGSPVEVVLESTNSECNYDFARLIETTSHEMVEAATDPLPASLTGYKNRDPGGQFGEEIGDLCQNYQVVGFLGVGEGSGTGVTEYWSDNANGCVVPFPLTPPKINKVVPCGWGKDMSIMLEGVFGAAPWDLTAGTFNGQTLYLNLVVSGTDNWSAGNVLNGDPVGLGPITWKQAGIEYPTDTIIIQGFGTNYGSNGRVVRPGDKLIVSVYSVKNGQAQTTVLSTPSPMQVQFDPAPVLNVGGSATVSGTVYAGSGCGIEGVNLALTVDRGVLKTSTGTGTIGTKSDGSFSATYQASAVAGVVTLTASSPNLPKPASEKFPVSPVLSALSPTQGPVSGGTKVTVSGLGFDNHAKATTAMVVGVIGPNNNAKVAAAPTVVQVDPNHSSVVLTMPRSPFVAKGAIGNSGSGPFSGGPQSVNSGGPTGANPSGGGAGQLTITVNGAQSNALEYFFVCSGPNC